MSQIQISDFDGKIINMHTHTYRCQHAKKCDDREYVEKAIEAGYEVLGFSDHAPYVLQEEYVSPINLNGLWAGFEYPNPFGKMLTRYKGAERRC